MVKKLLFLTFCSIYLYGSDVDFKNLEEKAKSGDTKSQYELGLIYDTGNDEYKIKQNVDEAFKWYQKAAKGGNKDAMLAIILLKEAKNKELSKNSETNNIEIRDIKRIDLKDTNLFNSLVNRANSGDAKAQYQLGLIYNNGYGVKEDRKEALSWYEKSSKQGYKDAILALEILKEADNK